MVRVVRMFLIWVLVAWEGVMLVATADEYAQWRRQDTNPFARWAIGAAAPQPFIWQGPAIAMIVPALFVLFVALFLNAAFSRDL